MRTLQSNEIKKILKTAALDKGVQLVRDKRVYKLKQSDDGWTACVLAEAPLPYLCYLHENGERLDWSCECGADTPCNHLWALAARLYQDQALNPGAIRTAMGKILEPSHTRKASVARGQGANLDLFDEGLNQPSLFEDLADASNPVEYTPTARSSSHRHASSHHHATSTAHVSEAQPEPDLFGDLGTTDTHTADPRSPGSFWPRSAPIPHATPKEAAPARKPLADQRIHFLVRFQTMNRPDLWVETVRLPSHHPQAWPAELTDIATALETQISRSPESQLSFGAVHTELAQLDTLSRDAGLLPRHPVVCFATPGRKLAVQIIDSIEITPVYARAGVDNKPRYHLQLGLVIGNKDGGTSVHTVPASSVATEGGLAYTFLRDDDTILYRHGDSGVAGLIARIKNYNGPVSALDIEGLRTWIVTHKVTSATLPSAGTERFEYRDVSPRPILSIQGVSGRTEVFLSFSYDGTECALHDEIENLTKNAGNDLTIVMKRRRDLESTLLGRMKELLSDCPQYERGLYAGLVGGRTVADLNVVGEFRDFVTIYGKVLMDHGYELRMEGKPVRAGGGISFRAESGIDWFGFRAGWKPEDKPDSPVGLDGRSEEVDAWELNGGGHSTGSLHIEIDSHLENCAMTKGTDENGVESWIILGRRDLDRLKLLRELGMDTSGMLETSPVNVTLIDSLYAEIENQDEENVKRARELSQKLSGFAARHTPEGTHSNTPVLPDLSADPHAPPVGLVPQPAGLQATLRSYQLVGFNWLAYLHEQNLGGCLADDMGLGKTVQTITLLQYLKERGKLGPSIMIAPVVTLPNWEDELARFAPTLKFKRHAGIDRARTVQALLAPPEAAGKPPQTDAEGEPPPTLPTDQGQPSLEGEDAGDARSGVWHKPHEHRSEPAAEAIEAWVDLVLVSYHTLRNDLDLFVQHQWDYIILDEAHYIKNASSQLFKAIRVLPSKHRLSLTGTPIENSTMELWSQFSFLNPGLLGSRKKFQSDIASPIERGGDESALTILRDTISPFILRRRKQDVLKDLPPKDEILFWCEMAPDQARLYDEHRNLYRDQIAGILNEKGVERSSLDIFRFLLRLRQIAINPAMISHAPRDAYGDPDDVDESSGSPYAHISSAKMESLRMLLDESMQEDHKMLVFSQFVTALKLISTDLDKHGQRHALLTGATVDRRTQVHAFQNDAELRIFLLSLKAGGVGINLTSADYVVLFDPWWNPAAERQAVDRAHRIGQKRPVIVYKFITRNTIEEKILALQAKKHRLMGSLIAGEDTPFAGMNEDEVLDLFK